VKSTIDKLINLKTLDLSDNNIDTLPIEINNLTNTLVTVRLDGNPVYYHIEWNHRGFQTFPVFLYKHMTSLHSISLATNYIHEIPEEIQRITGLVNLNLNYNKIMNLPRGIAHLTTLTALEKIPNIF